MKKFENKEAAFASQNYDPSQVVITGVPEQHIEALKAVANLFVAYDAVNPKFNADFTNYTQKKYESIFDFNASPGGKFAFYGVAYVHGWAASAVSARLVAESSSASRHLAEICKEDWEKFMIYTRKTT